MTSAIEAYLKYANLQMAAEATGLESGMTGNQLKDVLVLGNTRTSKFPTVLAEDFVRSWTVVDHKANTGTGFSGTLFRNNQTGELVMSFRSTEFADDAVRDTQATNSMEIQEKGWAFGQIADMEEWVNGLKQSGKLDPGASLTVTGYSLGGHLATAFALLHKNDLNAFGGPLVSATYTFNGAGVGAVNAGANLTNVIAAFRQARDGGSAALFTTSIAHTGDWGHIREIGVRPYI